MVYPRLSVFAILLIGLVSLPNGHCLAQGPKLLWRFDAIRSTTEESSSRSLVVTVADKSYKSQSQMSWGFIREGKQKIQGLTVEVVSKPIKAEIVLPGGQKRIAEVGNGMQAGAGATDDVQRHLDRLFAAGSHTVLMNAESKPARTDLQKKPDKLDARTWEKYEKLQHLRFSELISLFNPPPMAQVGATWDAKITVTLGDDLGSSVEFVVAFKLTAIDARPNQIDVDMNFKSAAMNSLQTAFTTTKRETIIPLTISASSGKLVFDHQKGQIVQYEHQVAFSTDCQWNREDEPLPCRIECDWSQKFKAVLENR